MKTASLTLLLVTACTGFLSAAPFMNVGAVSQFGTLNGVEFQSCAVSYFLDEQRIYVCYRARKKGDLEIGERVLGSDVPVSAAHPDGALVSRVVLGFENHFGKKKTQFFELPKEAYRTLTYPHLGERYEGRRTNLAIALAGDTLTVFLSGGDGAGSYRINWEIDVKERKARRIVQAPEMNAVGDTGPWLALREIASPNIVLLESRKEPPRSDRKTAKPLKYLPNPDR